MKSFRELITLCENLIDASERFASRKTGKTIERLMQHHPTIGDKVDYAAIGSGLKRSLHVPRTITLLDEKQPYAAYGLWAVQTNMSDENWFVYYSNKDGHWYREFPDHVVEPKNNVTSIRH